jgi:hypothetical protein
MTPLYGVNLPSQITDNRLARSASKRYHADIVGYSICSANEETLENLKIWLQKHGLYDKRARYLNYEEIIHINPIIRFLCSGTDMSIGMVRRTDK